MVRQRLLEAGEESWRLKIRVIWLQVGKENTKYFQQYAKARKAFNTIWSLVDDASNRGSNFRDLAKMRVHHFQSLFLARREASLGEIMHNAQYFPLYAIDEDNDNLL